MAVGRPGTGRDPAGPGRGRPGQDPARRRRRAARPARAGLRARAVARRPGPAGGRLHRRAAAALSRPPVRHRRAGRDLLLRCVYGLRSRCWSAGRAPWCHRASVRRSARVAGSLGGWPDRLLMRIVDTLSSGPAPAARHLHRGDLPARGLARSSSRSPSPTGSPPPGSCAPRCSRCATRPFIDAAVSGGASRAGCSRRHLLPAVLPQAALRPSSLCRTPCGTSPRCPSSAWAARPPGQHRQPPGRGRARFAARGGWWTVDSSPALLLVVPTLAVAGIAGPGGATAQARRRSELGL